MAKYKQRLEDIYGINSEDRSSFGSASYKEQSSSHFFNKRYHRHFRGYTEVRVINEYGIGHTERYYTSPWTVCELSDIAYWGVRIAFILLLLVSAALFIFAMAQKIPANGHWIIAVPGFLTVISLIILFARVGIFFAAPRKMTLGDFESASKRLRQFALTTAIIEAVTGIALIIFALVTKEEAGKTVLCGLLDILAACAAAAIFVIERKLPYKEIPNDTVLPEGEAYKLR